MEAAKPDNTQEIVIASEKYVLGKKYGSPWLVIWGLVLALDKSISDSSCGYPMITQPSLPFWQKNHCSFKLEKADQTAKV